MSLYADEMKDQVLKQYEIEIASLKRELANERKKIEELEVLRKQLDAMITENEMLKTQNDALKVEVKHFKEIQAGKVINVECPVKKVSEVPLEVLSKVFKTESLYDLTDTSDIIYFNPGEDPCNPELDDDTKAMSPSISDDSEDDFDDTSDIIYFAPNEPSIRFDYDNNDNTSDESVALSLRDLEALDDISFHSAYPVKIQEKDYNNDEDDNSVCSAKTVFSPARLINRYDEEDDEDPVRAFWTS